MRRSIGLLGVAILLAGCAGNAASPVSSTGAAPATAPTALPTEAQSPTDAPAPASASSGTAGEGYLVCPALEGDLCPVPPGPYQVDIHDAFSMTVPDTGWIESPSATEEEPTLVLARADAPDQRVMIDNGPTGAIFDEADLLHLLDLAVAAGASAPIPADIGGAEGYQVEITPSVATQVGLGQAGAVDIEPGRTYRIAALQVPVGQESVLKVIVVAAPTEDFAAFAARADGLLKTVQFVP